ncbi:unnamed protein product, partial [Didymodactylos carnosus]
VVTVPGLARKLWFLDLDKNFFDRNWNGDLDRDWVENPDRDRGQNLFLTEPQRTRFY